MWSPVQGWERTLSNASLGVPLAPTLGCQFLSEDRALNYSARSLGEKLDCYSSWKRIQKNSFISVQEETFNENILIETFCNTRIGCKEICLNIKHDVLLRLET